MLTLNVKGELRPAKLGKKLLNFDKRMGQDLSQESGKRLVDWNHYARPVEDAGR